MAVDFKQGRIGGFSISASSIASSNGLLQLHQDGSGSFAGGNFTFDTSGNIYINGRLSTKFVEMLPQSSINISSNNIIINYTNLASQAKSITLNTSIDGAIVYVLLKCMELSPSNSSSDFVTALISGNAITIYRRTSGFSYTLSIMALMYVKVLNKWIPLYREYAKY